MCCHWYKTSCWLTTQAIPAFFNGHSLEIYWTSNPIILSQHICWERLRLFYVSLFYQWSPKQVEILNCSNENHFNVSVLLCCLWRAQATFSAHLLFPLHIHFYSCFYTWMLFNLNTFICSSVISQDCSSREWWQKGLNLYNSIHKRFTRGLPIPETVSFVVLHSNLYWIF